MEIIVPISVKLTLESQTLIDALNAVGKAAITMGGALTPARAETPPTIGAPWRGGKYAGISVGEAGQPDSHIVLLADKPSGELTWQASLDWAKNLGDGARLPTKRESPLLYGNLPDEFVKDWHWTSTPYSGSLAWLQDFDFGYQFVIHKSSERLCRAVRRFPL
jgi:hypothetical protein